MRGEVVHHHDVAWREFRGEHVLNAGDDGRCVLRSLQMRIDGGAI